MKVLLLVWLPRLGSLIQFFNLSFEIQLFSNFEKCLFTLSTFSEVFHVIHSDLVVFLKSLLDEILDSLLVAKRRSIDKLVTEKKSKPPEMRALALFKPWTPAMSEISDPTLATSFLISFLAKVVGSALKRL